MDSFETGARSSTGPNWAPTSGRRDSSQTCLELVGEPPTSRRLFRWAFDSSKRPSAARPNRAYEAHSRSHMHSHPLPTFFSLSAIHQIDENHCGLRVHQPLETVKPSLEHAALHAGQDRQDSLGDPTETTGGYGGQALELRRAISPRRLDYLRSPCPRHSLDDLFDIVPRAKLPCKYIRPTASRCVLPPPLYLAIVINIERPLYTRRSPRRPAPVQEYHPNEPHVRFCEKKRNVQREAHRCGFRPVSRFQASLRGAGIYYVPL